MASLKQEHHAYMGIGIYFEKKPQFRNHYKNKMKMLWHSLNNIRIFEETTCDISYKAISTQDELEEAQGTSVHVIIIKIFVMINHPRFFLK